MKADTDPDKTPPISETEQQNEFPETEHVYFAFMRRGQEDAEGY